MSIDLFVPSRGRPAAARELADSFSATKALDTTRLVFLVDSDDPTGQDYPTEGCTVLFDAPTGDPTGPLNRASLASEATIVGFMGDDSRAVTPGWDAIVERALVEPGFAWGDDGHDIPWASTAFATADIIRATGYFALPSLRRGYFDKQWMTVSSSAGCAHQIAASFPHHNGAHPVAADVIAADEVAYDAWRSGGGAERDTRIARQLRDLAHFFPPDLIYA